MIDISIQRDEKGRIRVVESKGHAGHSHFLAKFLAGERDMVCAAVSALLQTIPLGLEGCLKAAAEQKKGKGYLRLTIQEEIREKSGLLLESVVLGLKAIEKKYPPHLKVEERTKISHRGHREHREIEFS